MQLPKRTRRKGSGLKVIYRSIYLDSDTLHFQNKHCQRDWTLNETAVTNGWVVLLDCWYLGTWKGY